MAKKVDAVDWGNFEKISAVASSDRSIIAASQGLTGTGRTHFWLTAPEPIAYFLFDPGGLKGLKSNPLFRKKDIRVRDYCGALNIGKLAKEDRITRSLDVMGKFQEDWAVAQKLARSLVVDKEPMLWEMVRYAHDEVDSPEPRNFHELNLLIRGWIQDAEVNGKNFGLIRDMHDTWGKTGTNAAGRPTQGFTGIFKPDGNKYVPSLVQINLEHRWDEASREFQVKILEKCRLGPAVDLMGVETSNLDFPTLGMLLYPESEPEEWL